MVVVISSHILVLLTDSLLAQLVKELDLCLFLFLIQRLRDRNPVEPISNFSLQYIADQT